MTREYEIYGLGRVHFLPARPRERRILFDVSRDDAIAQRLIRDSFGGEPFHHHAHGWIVVLSMEMSFGGCLYVEALKIETPENAEALLKAQIQRQVSAVAEFAPDADSVT